MNRITLSSLLFLGMLCACSSNYTDESITSDTDARYRGMGKLFGDKALTFGGASTDEATGITVNAYLWRAGLDTFSFMPLQSVDPFGGVIITDWYVTPASPNERFRANVTILSKQLRSDGIKVAVFKEVMTPKGWVSQPCDHKVATDFEDSILTKARTLKARDHQ